MAEQFIDFFDRWAAVYDQSVAGNDVEYKDVFKSYDKILHEVAHRSSGDMIEFGVGTGNLTKQLVDKGHHIIGIEPSENMRIIAKKKLPEVTIVQGHFLDFPYMDRKVDTIASSYAFHHLTDQEKEEAIKIYARLLNTSGKIVFADTIFIDEEAKEQAIASALKKNYHRLANDLQTEYYTTIPYLDHILKTNRFTTQYKQMNDFVWIIEAKKERINNGETTETNECRKF
ncbi:MAG TPA: class I SAM-dependent methyltransferase [Bacillota bacterium]